MNLYLPISYSDLKISDQQQDILFTAKGLNLGRDFKVGLVGDNGSGKSTLLSFLKQSKPNSFTYILPPTRSIKVYDWLVQFDNWWTILEKLESIFKTEVDLETNWNKLSGGERAKLVIASTLSSTAAVFLLDEPTNHLDLASRRNLTNYLAHLSKAVVIATHDRELLNVLVNTVWEIDSGVLNVFDTNWQNFCEQKEAKIQHFKRQQQELKNQQKQMLQALHRERIRAAKTSSKNYLRKLNTDGFAKGFFKNESEVSHSKRLHRLENQLDDRDNKLDGINIEKPNGWRWAIVSSGSLFGKILVAKVKEISVNNATIISDSELSIKANERIGIVGRNGSGKSLLIKSLLNSLDLEPNVSYEIELKVSADLSWDQLSQYIDTVEQEISLQSYLEGVEPENIGGFGLIELWRERNRLLSELSAGQLVRTRLAKLSSKPLNLLTADEPTNNLDLSSTLAVQRGLNNYQGALLVVSHDLNFLSELKLDTIWEIKDNRIHVYKYADWAAS